MNFVLPLVARYVRPLLALTRPLLALLGRFWLSTGHFWLSIVSIGFLAFNYTSSGSSCHIHIHSLVRINGVYSQECELGGSALTGTKATGSRIGLTLHHYIAFCGSRWVVSRHIIPGLTLLTN